MERITTNDPETTMSCESDQPLQRDIISTAEQAMHLPLVAGFATRCLPASVCLPGCNVNLLSCQLIRLTILARR